MNKNDLNKAWENYNKVVDNLAVELFNSKILPYLKKHNCRFLAGNGTYYIEKCINGKWKDIYPESELPKRIYNILEMEIIGLSYPLGAIMPDYDPKVE